MVKAIDSERLMNELLGVQRREGEGTQMIEGDDSSPHPNLIQPARRRVKSLRWNERFVIQPFHRSHGIFLIKQEPAVKTG